MIVVSIISLIISLFLQGLASNFFNYSLTHLSCFTTVYVLINLIVLQQYYESDKRNLILVIASGIIMDIVYNNTFILSACIFVLIFYLNKFLSFYFPYNVLTVNIFSIISIIIYHILSFIILSLLQFDNYRFLILLKVLGCNIIMTIVYTTIIYNITDYLYKKFNLKKVREKYW